MKTIFLQLIDEDYKSLVDGLCLAINETTIMALKEPDQNLKLKLEEEAKELERILSELGNQSSSQ